MPAGLHARFHNDCLHSSLHFQTLHPEQGMELASPASFADVAALTIVRS